jgi:hypothetical protein
MMRPMLRRPLMLFGAPILIGCAGHRPVETCAAAAVDGPPILVSLRPDSIATSAVATEQAMITLVGCAFGSAPVRVSMGPATVQALTPTDAGTRIEFPVPAFIASGGEAPPMPTPAGTYDIVVTTARGRSGPRTLTVY